MELAGIVKRPQSDFLSLRRYQAYPSDRRSRSIWPAILSRDRCVEREYFGPRPTLFAVAFEDDLASMAIAAPLFSQGDQTN